MVDQELANQKLADQSEVSLQSEKKDGAQAGGGEEDKGDEAPVEDPEEVAAIYEDKTLFPPAPLADLAEAYAAEDLTEMVRKQR